MGVEVLEKWEILLFRRVDILQRTSVYSGRIHGAPLSLRLLLQVVLQYRLFSICIKNTCRPHEKYAVSNALSYLQDACAYHLSNDFKVIFRLDFCLDPHFSSFENRRLEDLIFNAVTLILTSWIKQKEI